MLELSKVGCEDFASFSEEEQERRRVGHFGSSPLITEKHLFGIGHPTVPFLCQLPVVVVVNPFLYDRDVTQIFLECNKCFDNVTQIYLESNTNI